MMTFLFTLYCVSAFGLFVYGVNCYVLVHRFYRHRTIGSARLAKIRKAYAEKADGEFPTVTIQLPVYNEPWVVGRLLQAVCRIQWPREKLDIQILDDSTDETTSIVQEHLSFFQAEGVSITHLHRRNREGFKAGALEAGLLAAKGEFLAVFDADFVPGKDFLQQTIPFFTDQKVGMVQTRWSHLNENYSLLTRTQAVGIDRHFAVEQSARCWAGFFLNFNGTGGVWRRQAIEEAGGWQADTLTEDLDLSYRAQLCGWKMEYLPDVDVPSEIPADVSAFKSQQRRWAKGSIQTAIKLIPNILAAKVPTFTKLQAVIHLTHYLIHPLIMIIALTSIPLMTYESSLWSVLPFASAITLLCLATAGPSTLYLTAQRVLHKHWLRRMIRIPALMVLGTGVAVSNTRAVVEAFLGTTNSFVRTPKHHIVGSTRRAQAPSSRFSLDLVFVLEILMVIYSVTGLWISVQTEYYMVSPFLLLYSLGFLLMVSSSAGEALLRWRYRSPTSVAERELSHLRDSEIAYQEVLESYEVASLKNV